MNGHLLRSYGHVLSTSQFFPPLPLPLRCTLGTLYLSLSTVAQALKYGSTCFMRSSAHKHGSTSSVRDCPYTYGTSVPAFLPCRTTERSAHKGSHRLGRESGCDLRASGGDVPLKTKKQKEKQSKKRIAPIYAMPCKARTCNPRNGSPAKPFVKGCIQLHTPKM